MLRLLQKWLEQRSLDKFFFCIHEQQIAAMFIFQAQKQSLQKYNFQHLMCSSNFLQKIFKLTFHMMDESKTFTQEKNIQLLRVFLTLQFLQYFEAQPRVVSKHFLEVETGKVHIFLPFTNIFGIWRISVIILQEGSSQKIPGLKVLKKVASVGHKNHFSAIKRIFKDFDFFFSYF